jgi:uncharacterized protein YndB with AHSA1/START domain
MATATKSETVEVRRTIAASPQRVFEAWTRPEELKRWAAPGPMETSLAEVDLRVGGSYRLHMHGPDGSEFRVRGTYREIDPPRRLVYTWSTELSADVVDSVVTVEFLDRSGSTEVVLRHDKLITEQSRARHTEGWIGCIAKLEDVLTH